MSIDNEIILAEIKSLKETCVNLDFLIKILNNKVQELCLIKQIEHIQPQFDKAHETTKENIKLIEPQTNFYNAEEINVENKQKKIAVEQKIFYKGTDSPIPLADVQILNSNKQKIALKKATPSGKWRESLAVGNYIIQVKRRAGPDRPVIDSEYEIFVSDAADNLILSDKYL